MHHVSPLAPNEPTQEESLTQVRTLQHSPATGRSQQINDWILQLDDWILVLSKWKAEAMLMSRLAHVSSCGEDNFKRLNKLNSELEGLVTSELSHLERDICALQQHVDLMKRFFVRSHQKMRLLRSRLKELSDRFYSLKSELLLELTRTYPVTIV